MRKIEHLGIAVKNLANSADLFSKLLGLEPYKEEIVESEGVKTLFFSLGESKIELLEGLGEENPIRKFIDKKGEGIHHIAFDVEDIQAEISRLQKKGFEFIKSETKKGADNKEIVFLHPKSTGGVLIELCSDLKKSTL